MSEKGKEQVSITVEAYQADWLDRNDGVNLSGLTREKIKEVMPDEQIPEWDQQGTGSATTQTTAHAED